MANDLAFDLRALLPITLFYVLCGTLFIAYLAGIAELVSTILVIPLFLWTRRKNSQKQASEPVVSVKSSLTSIMVVYVVVMSFRTPSAVFLGFPLEKTPLILLLVLWILRVERRPLSNYGLRTWRWGRQLMLGGFLYATSQLIPLLVVFGILNFAYDFNPIRAVDSVAFLLAMPFQTLAVGVSEEGFFRGYIQTKMMQITGIKRAVLFQAGLFGAWHLVWHLNPLDIGGMTIHVATTFLFGMFTGAFYNRTRSISALAFFHGLSNSVELSSQLSFAGAPVSGLIIGAASVALIIASGISLVVFSRRITLAFKVLRETPNQSTVQFASSVGLSH